MLSLAHTSLGLDYNETGQRQHLLSGTGLQAHSAAHLRNARSRCSHFTEALLRYAPPSCCNAALQPRLQVRQHSLLQRGCQGSCWLPVICYLLKHMPFNIREL